MSYMNTKKKNEKNTSKINNDLIIKCVSCGNEFEHTKHTKKRCGNYCVQCDLAAERRTLLRSKINNIEDAIFERRQQASLYANRAFSDFYKRKPLSQRELLSFLKKKLKELKSDLDTEISFCRFYADDKDVELMVSLLYVDGDDISWFSTE